jgi:CxxC motif-containing protein (DUF1111 family)
MKVRNFVALGLFVAWAGALMLSRSVSANGGRGQQYGQPLDGLTMDQRKRFRDGREAFLKIEAASDGLGPIFNNVSCVSCHSSPAVGGASPILETRAQKLVGGSLLEFPGGSLFQSNAINGNCGETIPTDANVRAQRQTTPLFGLGLVDAIPDAQIEGYAAEQARAHPEQAGRVNRVTDVASGNTRVGRFGWKDQQATLDAFSGDAYLNEMGITSRLFPADNPPNGNAAKLAACDAVKDPEDTDDDVTAFTNFMRFLAPPPGDSGGGGGFGGFSRGRRGHGGAGAGRGEQLFERVGCAVCHRAGFTASSGIAAINGQTVDAYSDFLLHDVGTGDGIAQGTAPPNMLRTPPLWGVSDSGPYLHDGSATTIKDAIRRHANQGAAAARAFEQLSRPEEDLLLAFLDSL